MSTLTSLQQQLQDVLPVNNNYATIVTPDSYKLVDERSEVRCLSTECNHVQQAYNTLYSTVINKIIPDYNILVLKYNSSIVTTTLNFKNFCANVDTSNTEFQQKIAQLRNTNKQLQTNLRQCTDKIKQLSEKLALQSPLKDVSDLHSRDEEKSDQPTFIEPKTQTLLSTAPQQPSTAPQQLPTAPQPPPTPVLPAYEPIKGSFLPPPLVQWPTYPSFPSYTPNFIPYCPPAPVYYGWFFPAPPMVLCTPYYTSQCPPTPVCSPYATTTT